jgi:cell division transport system permease protein
MSRSYSAFAAWRAQHAAALRGSFARLLRRPFSSLLSLAVMAIALALPLALAWSMLQMNQLATQVQTSRAIQVFFQPEVGVAQAKAIAEEFRAAADVASVTVKTPEQGLADFKDSSALAKAVAVLGENPLPAVMIVTPRADEAALLGRLQALPQAEYVQYDGIWQKRLDAWLAFGQRLLLLLALLFVSGAVLAVANNIRLDIATREQEITVMQQLGAGDAYIRRPFLYAGGLLGLLAGTLALGILSAAAFAISPEILGLIRSYGSDFAFTPLPLFLPSVVLAAATLLGVFGARLAAGHYLRLTRPVDR